MKGQGFARRVTAENLDTFAPLLRASDSPMEGNRDADAANETGEASPELEAALALFQGESVVVPRRRQGAWPRTPPEPAAPRTLADFLSGERRLLWRKGLFRSDVQSQTGNPTGGVRLTQAGFSTAAGRIDQTRYFREEVFGGLAWTVGRPRPYREDAWADFDVTIRGSHLGVHRLRISHKPSGEAGQHNYTTILHWGELGETVKQMGLVGADFRLYAPPKSEAGPFSIDII